MTAARMRCDETNICRKATADASSASPTDTGSVNEPLHSVTVSTQFLVSTDGLRRCPPQPICEDRCPAGRAPAALCPTGWARVEERALLVLRRNWESYGRILAHRRSSALSSAAIKARTEARRACGKTRTVKESLESRRELYRCCGGLVRTNPLHGVTFC